MFSACLQTSCRKHRISCISSHRFQSNHTTWSQSLKTFPRSCSLQQWPSTHMWVQHLALTTGMATRIHLGTSRERCFDNSNSHTHLLLLCLVTSLYIFMSLVVWLIFYHLLFWYSYYSALQIHKTRAVMRDFCHQRSQQKTNFYPQRAPKKSKMQSCWWCQPYIASISSWVALTHCFLSLRCVDTSNSHTHSLLFFMPPLRTSLLP